MYPWMLNVFHSHKSKYTLQLDLSVPGNINNLKEGSQYLLCRCWEHLHMPMLESLHFLLRAKSPRPTPSPPLCPKRILRNLCSLLQPPCSLSSNRATRLVFEAYISVWANWRVTLQMLRNLSQRNLCLAQVLFGNSCWVWVWVWVWGLGLENFEVWELLQRWKSSH